VKELKKEQQVKVVIQEIPLSRPVSIAKRDFDIHVEDIHASSSRI
jgi:hypothetical protein